MKNNNHKKKALILLILSLITFMLVVGTCVSKLDYLCRPSGYYGTLSFLLAYSLIFIPVSLALFFSSRTGFDIWKKFSIIYIPIVIFVSIITPIASGFMNPDKQMVIWWTAGLFFVISIGIILGKRE